LHIFGPTHVAVIPKGSEVIMFLKASTMGKTRAILWSRKSKMSGISGIGSNGGNGVPRIWQSTKRRQRKNVKVWSAETEDCLDKIMLMISEESSG